MPRYMLTTTEKWLHMAEYLIEAATPQEAIMKLRDGWMAIDFEEAQYVDDSIDDLIAVEQIHEWKDGNWRDTGVTYIAEEKQDG